MTTFILENDNKVSFVKFLVGVNHLIYQIIRRTPKAFLSTVVAFSAKTVA